MLDDSKDGLNEKKRGKLACKNKDSLQKILTVIPKNYQKIIILANDIQYMVPINSTFLIIKYLFLHDAASTLQGVSIRPI